MENRELKPCPVCNKLPKIKRDYCSEACGFGAWCTIQCKPFLRKPHLKIEEGKASWERALKYGIEHWNRRADDASRYIQKIKELAEEVERLGAEKEHLDLVVEGKLKRTTALEKQVLKLTEENERLVTALANYDRQTEVRIAEEYYTAEAYEELREENANLHASCTEFERKCASLNDEVERLRDSSIDYRNIPYIIAEAKADTVKEFAERLIAEFRKDGRMNYYIRMTLDQIAKEMLDNG